MFGEQFAPLLHVPEQAACVVTEQEPSAAQQEPVGAAGTHGSGEHVPPLVHVPLIMLQLDSVTTEHWFVNGAQQEPVGGCGHKFGEQLPPLLHVPVQLACVVSEQVPSAAQQEPVGWVQVFGEQVANWVNTPPGNVGPPHACAVVTVQEPSGMQHEPTHGSGEQAVPVP